MELEKLDIGHFGQLIIIVIIVIYYVWCCWGEEYKTFTEDILLNWQDNKTRPISKQLRINNLSSSLQPQSTLPL